MNKDFEERTVKNYEIVNAVENMVRKENKEGLKELIKLFELETDVEELMNTTSKVKVKNIIIHS